MHRINNTFTCLSVVHTRGANPRFNRLRGCYRPPLDPPFNLLSQGTHTHKKREIPPAAGPELSSIMWS